MIRHSARFLSSATVAVVVVGAALTAPTAATSAPKQGAATAGSVSRALTPTRVRILGKSVQGRPIVARLYGSPTSKKVGVLIGSMHGSELAGLHVVRRFAEIGPAPGTAVWVIPTINPDGSRIGQRKNARGVDLNRNGPHLWKGTARAPDYYPGPRAMSEPETRVYMGFLNQVRPDVVLIYHQAGNGVDSYREKNRGLTRGLAAHMALPVKSFSCDGECTGTLTGWFNSTKPGAAITIELTRPVYAPQIIRWADAARWAVAYVPDVS